MNEKFNRFYYQIHTYLIKIFAKKTSWKIRIVAKNCQPILRFQQWQQWSNIQYFRINKYIINKTMLSDPVRIFAKTRKPMAEVVRVKVYRLPLSYSINKEVFINR